jgi:hypothetical protein
MTERAENAALIDEVKDILLDGSPKKISKYRKFGVETTNGFLKLLMSLGNTTFNSGDPELTGRFLGALFELAASGVLNENTLMGRIREYGLRAIHGFYYDALAVILDEFLKYIICMRETVSVIMCLNILNKLFRGAVSQGYEAGMAKLVNVCAELDEHFEKEGLHVNRFYLRNLIISLVYFAGKDGDETLRSRIVTALMQTRPDGVLDFGAASPFSIEAGMVSV